MADHGFFQYERTLQREANPELCIYQPQPAQPQEGAALVHGAVHPAAMDGQGSELLRAAASNPAGGGGSTLEAVEGPKLEGGSGAAPMEVDQQAAVSMAALQNGGAQAGGGAGEQQNGSSAATNGQAGAPRAAQDSSKGSTALQNGGRAGGAGPVAAAEEGMQTVLIRIDYRLMQPTSGLTFWGAYAHTDNQVKPSCTSCVRQQLGAVLPAWHRKPQAVVVVVQCSAS